MGARRIASFCGSVQCRRQTGAINLMLRGAGRDVGDGTLTVLFAGASAPPGSPTSALPERLSDACVEELQASDGIPRWCIRWESGECADERNALGAEQARGVNASGTSLLELSARSVQVHREVGRSFFEALPRVHPTAAARIGWSTLFALLRLPGVARALAGSGARRAR